MTPMASALRAEFARHNHRVLLVVSLTALVAGSLWYLFYAALSWLTVLGASVIKGLDAKPAEVLPAVAIYSAALLIIVTAIARHWSPDDVARDHRSLLESLADFLLAVPRATLAVWGNLSAWQRLNDHHLAFAGVLLEQLAQEERLPLYHLPLLIPDRRTRRKVVFALQLVQLIELRREKGVAYLRLTRRAKRALPEVATA